MSKTVKLGEVQESVLRSLKSHRHWYPGCGWVWNTNSGTEKILQALCRLGYVKKEKNRYVPVDGDPAPVQEPGLPSPFKKVKRVPVKTCTTDGELQKDEAWVWLDPREDIEFAMMITPEMAKAYPKGCQLVDVDVYIVTGKTLRNLLDAYTLSVSSYHDSLTGEARRQIILIEMQGYVAGETPKSPKLDIGHINTADVAFQFTMRRYWLVSGNRLHDFDNPAVHQRYYTPADKEFVMLDYSEDLWNKLSQLRDALGESAQRIVNTVLGQDFKSRLLAMTTHQLMGPASTPEG